MKLRYFFASAVLALLTACSTSQAQDMPHSFGGINLIDRSSNLSLFTDEIVKSGHAFSTIQNFQSTFKFNCFEKSLVVNFETLMNEKNQLNTFIDDFKLDNKTINKKVLNELNSGLSAEIIGSVGFRCSTNKNADKGMLVIQTFQTDSELYIYKPAIKEFILSFDDFK